MSEEKDPLHVEPSDFACNCAADGKERCAAVMAWALDYLSTTNGTIEARPVARENFLSHVVSYLNWQYNASITGIANDQWSRIDSETYREPGDEKPVFRTGIQCDSVEDGLAFTLKAYYDEFGPTREVDDD